MNNPIDELSTRAAKCLWNLQIASKSEALKAFRSGRLYPGKVRNYGWATHKEIAKWLGLPEPSKPEPRVFLCELLAEVEQALDDWIVTYASDHCSKHHVKAAWKRISDNGGTIAYVTDLRERIHAAQISQKLTTQP